MADNAQLNHVSEMCFGGYPDEFVDPENAAAIIIPVPYDGTSTWKKGADRGPAALIEASHQVEFYDIESETEPYRNGIATRAPVIHEGGPEELADRVDEQVASVLRQSRLPVVLGGEHSVSIGAIRAAARECENLSVLQIDAHGDTRDSYEGSKFNHACVMARAREWCPCIQVGIRAIDTSEAAGLDRDKIYFAHQIAHANQRGDSVWMDEVVSQLTDNVYVTVDLDAFDPSIVPATGTPEPGGLGWYDVMDLFYRVSVSRRVVGFDVVELLPTPGQWASEFFAAKLVHRFLAMAFVGREQE